MKTPQTTKTRQESLSEIDWDAVDEQMTDPAQMEQDMELPSAPPMPSKKERMQEGSRALIEEMVAFGIPRAKAESPGTGYMATMFGSLQELTEAYPALLKE